uniref:Candidate secreted effector n=1 Tax=Meloidogyne incognita TaxID=6306 RepID=A0A914ML57_MELIC
MSKTILLLAFIFLTTLEINSAVDSSANNKKSGSTEPVKTEEKKEEATTPKPATVTCPPCPTPESPIVEEKSSGFGGGSIFLSILFGMGLMFGLTQLYIYWEKRRSGDLSTYPGY